MTFLSVRFLLFIVLVLTGLKLLKKESMKQKFLLLASFVFYMIADVRFFLLLILISLTAWFAGVCVKENKAAFVASIIICLSSLIVFKYFSFFAGSFAGLFGVSSAGTISFILPVGISFYTFRAISYICDVRMGKMKPVDNAWKVMLYIAFFPQIVSGPIIKASDFFSQLNDRKILTKKRLLCGIQLFILGLLKKVVIADRLGFAVDTVYSAPSQYSGFSLVVTAFAYSIQIYCDFSGYSDMAISLSYILGFNYEKNFDLPYIAENPSDFWRRWHISLSTWFREYVYIPLGGNRKGRLRTYLNLFITMLLSGFWHGASWNFVLWGGLHGMTSLIHKLYTAVFEEKGTLRIPALASRGINVLMVMLLWIPFRINDMPRTIMVFDRIVHAAPGISYISVFAVVYGVLVIGGQVIMGIYGNGHICWKPLNMSKFLNQVIVFGVILLIICFAYTGNSAFIYAGF